MNRNLFTSCSVLVLVVMAMLVSPSEASAYVGPGPGLSFISTLIGFIVAIFTSLFVIILYPVRRFLKRRKNKENEPQNVLNQMQNRETTVSEKK